MISDEEVDRRLAEEYGVDLNFAYGPITLGRMLKFTVEEELQFRLLHGVFPSTIYPIGYTAKQTKARRKAFEAAAFTKGMSQ